MSFWGRIHWSGGALAKSIDESSEPVRRLFVDVSTIVRHDAQTGIQRVVRSVCRELSMYHPRLRIHAVAATKWRPYAVVETELFPKNSIPSARGRLELGPGDAFLGLDLSAHLFFRHERQLRRWSAAGAEIAAVVYDLLPLAHPEWFSPKTTLHFRRWLDVIGRRANVVLPISRSVQADLAKYLTAHHLERAPQIRSDVLPLSGDIGLFQHNLPARLDPVTEAMRTHPAVLMVGTVEPRKGYAVALAAHRQAWATSSATAPLLIMAGKPGWQTGELQRELRGLNLERDGAVWLEDVDDAKLHELYRACRCVLVASLGEGYCLPLHEALAYGKPVLARDLPVLRELHSPMIFYFTTDDPENLALALVDVATRKLTPPTIPLARGWADTVRTILDALKVVGR